MITIILRRNFSQLPQQPVHCCNRAIERFGSTWNSVRQDDILLTY